MTAETPRGKAATLVVAVVTAGFLLLSLRQIWVRAVPSIPYAGMHGMSAPWNQPPNDDTTEWKVSEGQVPPPAANASHTELVSWLARYYPVLGLDLPKSDDPNAEPRLDLGGGPPRRLYVERGRGLVGREP